MKKLFPFLSPFLCFALLATSLGSQANLKLDFDLDSQSDLNFDQLAVIALKQLK